MIDYVMHYDYISQELCANKRKPVLHYNGNCYLTKELTKISKIIPIQEHQNQ
ncbi:hypothetical protein [Kaistella montana]|uniref:Uncharacterized protein n=1 Tax=Kaistella montana TaxID=1849733 RepID=A0ABW5K7U7_9FLAO|nr:hypothetical protein [Kaistella montana]MCQ4035295.1 hypothetical protein [Kaistella montana]